MTKEEAIKYLQQLYPNGGHCWLDEQRIEAIGMAVKALQEEPVDKCNGCNNVKGCITCVDGSEWAHYEEPVSEEPKYKGGDILYKINDGSKIEIIDIVADQYKFECGDEYPHYEFFGYIEHNYSKNPVSEELEDAKWLALDELTPTGVEPKLTSYTFNGMLRMFEKGTEWQKEQMMKEAVEREVFFEEWGHLVVKVDDMGVKSGENVKVLILKEE